MNVRSDTSRDPLSTLPPFLLHLNELQVVALDSRHQWRVLQPFWYGNQHEEVSRSHSHTMVDLGGQRKLSCLSNPSSIDSISDT